MCVYENKCNLKKNHILFLSYIWWPTLTVFLVYCTGFSLKKSIWWYWQCWWKWTCVCYAQLWSKVKDKYWNTMYSWIDILFSWVINLYIGLLILQALIVWSTLRNCIVLRRDFFFIYFDLNLIKSSTPIPI